MYQYWINVDDRDVAHYLRVFTFISLEEIETLMREQEADPGKRVAQKRLAFEITKLVHGETTARAVAAASSVLFGGSVTELTPEALSHLAGAVPTTTISPETLAAGLPILEALVASGAQPSRGAARRLMQQGGLYVNDARWNDPERAIIAEDALFGRAVLLRSGKNKYTLLLVG